MATTKAALAAQVLILIGNRTGYSTLIDNALDAAVEEVSARHDFADLITTPTDVTATIVEDASYVVIPTGYAKIKYLRHVRGTVISPIEMRTKTWIQDRYDSTYVPSTWLSFIEGANLYVVPDPETGDKIRFTMVSKIAFSGVTPTLNITRIDRVLVAFATSWVFEALEIPVSADRWLKRFEMLLKVAINEDNRKPKLIIAADGLSPATTMEQILEGTPSEFET